MLSSIDYQLVHSTAPSQIRDIALTEESNVIPANNDWVIVDEVPSLEPIMSNVGEQRSVQDCDGYLEQREVLGPAKPTFLVTPAENVVRSSSPGKSTGDNVGLPMPHPQRGDSSRPIDGQDITIPPASEGYSHQDLRRRDWDAELELGVQRTAGQAVAMLEEYHSPNREQAVSRAERQPVPVHAGEVAVVPTGSNLQATSRRSSAHVGSKRVTGVRRPRRQGFQKTILHQAGDLGDCCNTTRRWHPPNLKSKC